MIRRPRPSGSTPRACGRRSPPWSTGAERESLRRLWRTSPTPRRSAPFGHAPGLEAVEWPGLERWPCGARTRRERSLPNRFGLARHPRQRLGVVCRRLRAGVLPATAKRRSPERSFGARQTGLPRRELPPDERGRALRAARKRRVGRFGQLPRLPPRAARRVLSRRSHAPSSGVVRKLLIIARAARQSRATVLRDVPSASAISSRESPPKKRSSTSCASRSDCEWS